MKEIIQMKIAKCLKTKQCNSTEINTAIKVAEGLGGAKKRIIIVSGRKTIQTNHEVTGYHSVSYLDMHTYVDCWIIDNPKPSDAVSNLRKLIGKYATVIFVSNIPLSSEIKELILPIR